MNYLKCVSLALGGALLVAGCATEKFASKPRFAGYLGDYSRLAPVTGEGGEEIRVWINPRIKRGGYQKLLVEPVVFHPAPQASNQVTVETIDAMRRYTAEALRRELAKSYLLVNQVGPGVARVRIALTGVTTEAEGATPYEYVSIAAIVGRASTAAGNRDRQAFMIVEGELLDSVTHERLGMAVRKVPARPLLKDDTEKLTLDVMRPVIDERAAGARRIVDGVLK